MTTKRKRWSEMTTKELAAATKEFDNSDYNPPARKPTPPIPGWIKGFHHESYTNIYERCPNETRLYGTESLYGDWDGELLLLAQDFAPASLLDKRKDDPRPYHHTCWIKQPKMLGARTNKRLFCFAQQVDCRKLYGSVLANLLRNDSHGNLPIDSKIESFICRVLKFTVEHMPRLRAIACLGNVSQRYARKVYSAVDSNWRHRDIKLFEPFHPAARKSNELMRERWQPLYNFFGVDSSNGNQTRPSDQ
jgi:hypothetical protein